MWIFLVYFHCTGFPSRLQEALSHRSIQISAGFLGRIPVRIPKLYQNKQKGHPQGCPFCLFHKIAAGLRRYGHDGHQAGIGIEFLRQLLPQRRGIHAANSARLLIVPPQRHTEALLFSLFTELTGRTPVRVSFLLVYSFTARASCGKQRPCLPRTGCSVPCRRRYRHRRSWRR